MVVMIMAGFLLFRCFVTLLMFGDKMAKAKTSKDRTWSVVGMLVTGVAAFCIIYLAAN